MAQVNSTAYTQLLKDVSRSFYLTLRVLPSSVRPQIGLAYLLARTSDTIADTRLISPDQRLEALQAFRAKIAATSTSPLNFGALAAEQHSEAERTLLHHSETSVSLIQTLEPSDRDLVRKVLDIIISGQELDLKRFANCSPDTIRSLETEGELDDYTYRVAGCVGEFWTRICRAHVFPSAALNDTVLLQQSLRFGKGLQLVNILRDIAADLRIGRCYLPEERLRQASLTPPDLLDPKNEAKLRPVYNRYLDLAHDHLTAGWEYTNALPWRNMRVRLGCAWPILIGFETIKILRNGNMLDPGPKLKVSRREVKKWLWRSVLYYPFPSTWQSLARL